MKKLFGALLFFSTCAYAATVNLGASVIPDQSGNANKFLSTNGSITAWSSAPSAATADALTSNPADCAANTYATTIAANGDLTCATVTNAGLAGSIAASKLIGTDIASVGTITSGTWAGTAIASLGTVTSGTWTGTTVAIANGGTAGTTSAAAFNNLSPMSVSGDVIYGGTSGAGTRLAKGTDGDLLASGTPPTWHTPTSTNTASRVVKRDSSGDFAGGTYTGIHTGRVNSTQVVETVVAGGTCSTTYTVDPTTGTMFNVTLNGACNFAITNLAAGHSFTIKMTQSSTTAPTFASGYKWALATAPTWSTSATKYDMVACVSLDGTTLNCSGIVDVR